MKKMKRKDIQEMINRRVSDPYGRGYTMRPVINEGTEKEERCSSMRDFRQAVEEGDMATIRVYKRGADREEGPMDTIQFKVEPDPEPLYQQMIEEEYAELLGSVLNLYPSNDYGIKYETGQREEIPKGLVVVPNQRKSGVESHSKQRFVLDVYLDGEGRATIEKGGSKDWKISGTRQTRKSVVAAIYLAASMES